MGPQGARSQPSASVRHKTTPHPDSLTSVPGYPRKLTIYRMRASCYWWVRYFVDGKVVRRSTKTENKLEAYRFAREFYDQINLRRAQGLKADSRNSFAECAEAMLAAMRAQAARGEITTMTLDNTVYRLKKNCLPVFGRLDVREINYERLEAYLNDLPQAKPKLSLSTLSSYLKLVKKVLVHAHKRQLLSALPPFPSVAQQDNPRGYFTKAEYEALLEAADALCGRKFDYRKLRDPNGQEALGQYFPAGQAAQGRKIRAVQITPDLRFLIEFMVNSFVRPTDIRHLKHCHVDIVRDRYTYLRLTLPESKKHDKPIVTMEDAVDVYERITESNNKRGWPVTPTDYVFLSLRKERGTAHKHLQQQFDVLMWHTGMGTDSRGKPRTLYSLRHTAIMFRLLYGERMDVITLARNARTSPEMIDRFYAAQLSAEDNVDLLQSVRSPKG